MKKLLIVCSLLFVTVWISCQKQNELANATKVKNYQLALIGKADSAIKKLRALVSTGATEPQLQLAFKNARLAYKRTEYLTEYYTPLTAKGINGAPIPSMDDNDQHRIDQPEGFQVVEPYLFPVYDASNKTELLKELDIMIPSFKRLEQLTKNQELADAQIFDALRLEVFRIITQGITGFDAAIAQNSMAEAAASLQTLHHVVVIYEEAISQKDKKLYANIRSLIEQNQAYLLRSTGFNDFNRMAYIKQFANPL